MKKLSIILTVVVSVLMMSCADIRFGDGAFSDPPENAGATIDSMFNSVVNSERVLATAYLNLPYGIPVLTGKNNDKLGWNGLEMITDLFHSWKDQAQDGPKNLYYNGSLSPNIGGYLQGSEAHRFGYEDQYVAIKYAWLYIENVSKVPNMSGDLRKIRIAEAKMVIALSYFEMLRYVGGVPLLKNSVDITKPLEFPRNTFAQTADYIVQLLDEAAADLPWVHENYSLDAARMTSAAAQALKLRVLCFVASPTFNSDTKWHAQADEYTCYGNYKAERWEKAYEAGKKFMRNVELNGHYGLVKPANDTHQARRLAFRKAYLETGTSEVLISVRKGFKSNLNDAYLNLNAGPTLNYVDMFPWEDGTDFPANFDWTNPSKQPFFTPNGSTPGIPTRDPRLYETVAVPGDLFKNDQVIAMHLNHPNTLGANVGATGFLGMKFVLQRESDRNIPPHWPYLRFAEVLLSYAEAINEHYQNPSLAYEYVNLVRERVGLPELPKGMSSTAFREALIRERALEFGNEEVRWFDLVRWGMHEELTKKLYRLESIGLDDATSPTEFSFVKKELPVQRYWHGRPWDSKWYLTPIPQVEINKDYGMTQNPGW